MWDLVCHPFEKKLLLIVPANMNNKDRTMIMCHNGLARFLKPENFRVVLADYSDHMDEDIVAAARELGWKSAGSHADIA